MFATIRDRPGDLRPLGCIEFVGITSVLWEVVVRSSGSSSIVQNCRGRQWMLRLNVTTIHYSSHLCIEHAVIMLLPLLHLPFLKPFFLIQYSPGYDMHEAISTSSEQSAWHHNRLEKPGSLVQVKTTLSLGIMICLTGCE